MPQKKGEKLRKLQQKRGGKLRKLQQKRGGRLSKLQQKQDGRPRKRPRSGELPKKRLLLQLLKLRLKKSLLNKRLPDSQP